MSPRSDGQRNTGRRATAPIPLDLVKPFYEVVWSIAARGWCLAQDGHKIDWQSASGRRQWTKRRHALSVLWMTSCALRFSEFRRLRVSDVSLGSASTWVSRSKGGDSGAVDVARALITLTFDWRSQRTPAFVSPWLLPTRTGSRMDNNSFNRDACGMFSDMFGIRLSSHCFRDTACQMAMRQSGELRVVQRLLGHRSARTTEHYLRKQQARSFQLSLYEPGQLSETETAGELAG
ncbi:site-specific tyrosine recombinase XerC [Rubripirellula lacrimiformis]|uniref:Site-specific tyrosine recombinase XerC n=1 Tax=Rubripirellula lacrimiformis TaxID=1930273 RepID=A0A517NLK7_9BACT|nr:site-specific integrase [Rubripirellula lacrimiformis]QDT07969.1 site-specific tyrosine recombinase XerC [Rubripirellula lacrimiformis]